MFEVGGVAVRTWFDHYVESVPGVQGGAPVIAGTRTPVWSIVEYDRVYGSDLNEVARALPHLASEQIVAALAYYQAHRVEIDNEISHQHDILEALPSA